MISPEAKPAPKPTIINVGKDGRAHTARQSGAAARSFPKGQKAFAKTAPKKVAQ